MLSVIEYLMFVMDRYIYEDWSVIKKPARFFLKPLWFIRSIIVWIYAITCFPVVLIHKYFYNHFWNTNKELCEYL